jgi:hypothetical protein
MKTASRLFAALAGLVVLLAVSGCKTVSITSNQYIGGPQYAPSNPADIQILRTPPTRPHVRLGEVRAEPSSDSVGVQQIEESMRKAAAKMGADAIVIVYDQTQVTGAMVTGPWYGRTIQRTVGRVVVGVAIKYTGG